MTFRPQGGRAHTYDPHPVPQRARGFGHIASYFEAEGDKAFTPRTNGRELAGELSRNLHPSARRMLLGGTA